MCMSIQQFAAVKRQRLAAELRHIIGPTVCQILPIRVMRKIDRTESLNLNRIVRLQTFEQVKCGAVFQPPVIMVADHTMQMLAIERSQAVLQMGQRCAETDITQNPQLVIRADQSVDMIHNRLVMRIRIGSLTKCRTCTERRFLGPILGDSATLRSQHLLVTRARRVKRREPSQHRDQRMPEMRVGREIPHDSRLPFSACSNRFPS